MIYIWNSFINGEYKKIIFFNLELLITLIFDCFFCRRFTFRRSRSDLDTHFIPNKFTEYCYNEIVRGSESIDKAIQNHISNNGNPLDKKLF